MSREGKRPRKTFSSGGSSDFNKRKSFSGSDKPKKTYKSESSGERKPYTKREGSEGGERRSFGDREKRSFGDKPFSSERKPYAKREGSEGGERKSYGDREKRSFGDKPFSSERKPYTKREGNEGGERRSYDGGEKKAFVKRADGKYESADRRPSGDSDRPRKSYSDDKPYSGEKRSYTKRDDSERGEKRSYTKRDDSESGERKSYGDRDGKRPAERKLAPSEKVAIKSKKVGPKKTSNQENVEDGAIRLNRYVANAGICSRREADVLIATGVVTVNGKIVTEMGYKVNPTDVVNYGGVPIKNEVKKYLLLNKPKDYITTMDDPQERRTVMELTRQACKERLYPVGRLDRNTTGVLLFTNDGDMTAKLTHPKFEVRKVYHVTLDKKMSTEDYHTLNAGFELPDGFIKPDAAEFVGSGKFELGIEIHSGRNRIVRRMFEHLGYEVMKLDRVTFAGLTKKDLPRGKFRFLTEKEISFLKMLG